MLEIRQAKLEDVPAIMQLDPERDVIPDETTLQSAVVLSDDCMVAYGALKLYAEFVLAVNKSVLPSVRATAISSLVKIGVHVATRKNLSEIHAFAMDEEFGNFLVKHFEFVPVKEQPFVLTLR